MIPDEGAASQNPEKVDRLVFCCGKVYYDILAARKQMGLEETVAIARVEQASNFRNLTSGSFSALLAWGVRPLVRRELIGFLPQIAPFPYDLIKAECDKYPSAKLLWSQEEHKNAGAWTYVQPRMFTTLSGSRSVSWEPFLFFDFGVLGLGAFFSEVFGVVEWEVLEFRLS